jgi:hypothetical protein
MNKKYPSAVDLWFAAFLIGTPLAIVVFGAFTLNRSAVAGIITIIAGVLIGILMAAFAIPCVYTLTDQSLKIKCGILEDDVPLTKIRKTERSSSTWSAPALSLRRVKITLDDGFRLISPRDRDGFIADLAARIGHEKRG